MSAPTPLSPTERQTALIARALAYVETHLDAALDADILADQAALSRHHFHRVFRAHMGCSVGTYVTWRRLQRASALLASGRETVLEIALAVGYESAQALAKAMRRELETTPSAVRRGDAAAWKNLLQPAPAFGPGTRSFYHASHRQLTGDPPMQPTRFANLPRGLRAYTATGRGMVSHNMTRAAQNAFNELIPPVLAAGLLDAAASHVSIIPDDPKGPDDPDCRYVAGLIFGYNMVSESGTCLKPDLPISGTLAWLDICAGRYAVFTHIGPYETLHQSWANIYRDWLPDSGEHLRDAPPMELMRNDPRTTTPKDLHTEIWVPVQ